MGGARAAGTMSGPSDTPSEPPADDEAARHAAAIEERVRRAVRQFRRDAAGIASRQCPLCGYQGAFTAYGRPPRFDAQCASCASLERHRLYALLIERRPDMFGPDDLVLHFAPERVLGRRIEPLVGGYETADLRDMRRLTHRVDIEDVQLPPDIYSRIVCNHVLEHVDDARALAELFRILQPGGRLLLTTPVVEGWAETYENPEVETSADRLVHFGQKDHRRVYGRDLRDRLAGAGFALDEFVAVEPDVRRYGLIRGETIFIATKPGAGAP